jgi:hypothetical protein
MKCQTNGVFIRLVTIILTMVCMSVAVAQVTKVKPLQGVPSETELLVYKKWIGASGGERNVEVHLDCSDDDFFQPRFINRDLPGGWQIRNIPKEGIFCTVSEIKRDTFIADDSDCSKLLVVPGQSVECTIVNTKIVKKIDMLNRYGLILMISVMLGAGLAAVKRYAPL